MKKKTIHLITSLEAGGAETQLYNLVLKEQEEGGEPIVICLKKKKSHILSKLRESNIQVYELQFKGIYFIYSLFNLLILFSRLSKTNSILVAWMYHACFLSIILKFLQRDVTVFWFIRRTEVPKGVTGFISKINSKFSCIVPNKIICNSNSGCVSHSSAGYCSDRLLLLPNAIDVASLQKSSGSISALKKHLGISDEKIVIGSVARYHPIKGHSFLLKALKRFPDVNFVCVLVGRGVSEAPELILDIEELHRLGKLIITGERRDVGTLMTMFDFFVLPSLSEGFPNVVAESMSLKTPCIVTDVGDASLIVGETGLVVAPGDVDELYAALSIFLKHSRESLSRLGDISSQRIMMNYELDYIFQTYRSIIEE